MKRFFTTLLLVAAIPLAGILAAGPAGNAFRGNMDAGFVAVSFTILLSGLIWLWGSRYLQRDTQSVLAGEMPR